MHPQRKSLFFSIFFLLLLQIFETNLLAQTNGAESSQLVWVDNESGEYEIYYSRSQGNSWGAKTKLSGSGTADRVPAMAKGHDNRIWVVWAALKGIEDGKITARYQENGRWSELLHLPSSYSFNTAPWIVVDNQNRPWVVWSAWDGEDDDIFVSHWDGQGWSKPQRVNIDDKQPDILPNIGMSANGKPWIYWQGLDAGRYRPFVSHWTGNHWSEEQRLDENNRFRGLLNQAAESMPTLPEFVHLPDEAVMQGQTTGEIQSLSRRFRHN